MNNQKVNYIPTVNNVQIVDFDFENDITTDVIDMPESNKAWSIHVNSLDASGAPTLTINCSNDGVNFVEYSTLTTDVNILLVPMVFETEFCPRYMQLVISSVGGASGDTISLSMTK
jgi:hypothetical protein